MRPLKASDAKKLASQFINIALDGRNRLIWYFTTKRDIPMAEIGRVLNISRQRVEQIKNSYAEYIKLYDKESTG